MLACIFLLFSITSNTPSAISNHSHADTNYPAAKPYYIEDKPNTPAGNDIVHPASTNLHQSMHNQLPEERDEPQLVAAVL